MTMIVPPIPRNRTVPSPIHKGNMDFVRRSRRRGSRSGSESGSCRGVGSSAGAVILVQGELDSLSPIQSGNGPDWGGGVAGTVNDNVQLVQRTTLPANSSLAFSVLLQ